MIKILNFEIDLEIEINYDNLIISPRIYEEKPYIKLELYDVILSDLRSEYWEINEMINSFGHKTFNWFLLYNSKLFRIDTQFFYQNKYGENSYLQIINDEGSRTTINFKLHEFQTDITLLRQQLKYYEEIENYRKAQDIYTLINEELFKHDLKNLIKDLGISKSII